VFTLSWFCCEDDELPIEGRRHLSVMQPLPGEKHGYWNPTLIVVWQQQFMHWLHGTVTQITAFRGCDAAKTKKRFWDFRTNVSPALLGQKKCFSAPKSWNAYKPQYSPLHSLRLKFTSAARTPNFPLVFIQGIPSCPDCSSLYSQEIYNNVPLDTALTTVGS